MLLNSGFFRFLIMAIMACWAAFGGPVPAILTDQSYEDGPMFISLWPGLLSEIDESWLSPDDPEFIGQQDLASDYDEE